MATSLVSVLSPNDPKVSEERSETILRLGRRQLESLREEGHPYGESRVRALRQLLADGGGLPLLFPDHDVGFRYSGEGAAVFAGKGAPPRPPLAVAGAAEPSSARSSLPFLGGYQERGDSSDGAVSSSHYRSSSSSSSSPLGTLRLGGRMPHFVLRPSWGENIDIAACEGSFVPSLSTVDLPDQIRELLLSGSGSKLPSAARLAMFDGKAATSASRARASLASVLVVSPLHVPSVAMHSGDRDRPDDSTVVPAAEAVSARWLSAAVAAQQPEVVGDNRGAATAGEGAGTDHRTPCRPLIVLTVSPLCRSSIPTTAAAITTTKTMPSINIIHLEAYLDHRSSTRTSPVASSEHVDAKAGAAVAAEGLQQSDDERLNSVCKGLGSKSSEADAAGDGGMSGTRAAVPGRQVLSMHAIDDSTGRLGKAFAAAGAEAILLRPDGHIAWLGRGLGLDFGSNLGSRGEGLERSDTELVQELRRALDTVYAMR